MLKEAGDFSCAVYACCFRSRLNVRLKETGDFPCGKSPTDLVLYADMMLMQLKTVPKKKKDGEATKVSTVFSCIIMVLSDNIKAVSLLLMKYPVSFGSLVKSDLALNCWAYALFPASVVWYTLEKLYFH
jgi:hypothetical protein